MIDLKCLIDAINVRKSVRSYSRRQLEEDTVDNILRFAASLEQPIADVARGLNWCIAKITTLTARSLVLTG